MLDGSTERRLTLAEVEPSNVFGGWLTDVGPPPPTNRISCDAGSDDLLRKMCHPVCSVSTTPSKAWLNGFCNKRRTPVRCHRENLQGSTSLHFVGSHNGICFRVAHLQDGQDAGLCELSGNMFETAY